ncbi:MAG: ATP synthase subunit I [Methylococcales bacterium]
MGFDKIGRKKVSTVTKIINLQALTLILITIGFFLYGGWQKAISPALGGIVALLPNGYFAYRIHLANGKEAKQVVRTFYAAEIVKIFLTAALFFFVFHVPGVEFLALLIGYIAAVSVHWFALILWRND